MRRLPKRLLGVLVALAVMVAIDVAVSIDRYGDGMVSPWQAVEVNLLHDTVQLEADNDGVLFLTDHDWTGEELVELGCVETDRMGTLGFYVAPDGRTFSVNDLNEWCWLFRLHRLKGATLEELGLHA